MNKTNMEKVKYRYNRWRLALGRLVNFAVYQPLDHFLCGSFHFPMCIFDRSAGIIVHHACIHKRD